jgi:serine protease
VLVELAEPSRPAGPAGPAGTPDPDSAPGAQILLGRGSLAVQAQPVLLLGGVPVQVLRPIFDGSDGKPRILLLATEAEDEAATRRHIDRIAADPRVRRAEPDRIRRPAATPNDVRFRTQWNLAQIRMPQAWERTTGSSKVVVAVLDTGILKGHPDLRQRLVPGYDFILDRENAGDQDGRDDDPTDAGSTEPGSSGLHGTHVAGIIGAASNNALGISGVDWSCRVMPVRVLGVRRGTGVDSDIADAIRWAAGKQLGNLPPPAQPAQVINMSFGGLGISFTVQRAVDEAIAAGAIVVAAAGNGADDAASYSPGGLDGVITVGAAGSKGKRAPYSNHGTRVDLLAPGGDDDFEMTGELGMTGVLSTYRDAGEAEGAGPYTYYPLVGTSQAAPHVSGAAALVRAIAPVQQLTMATLLRATADRKSRCDQDESGGCGAGLLNVDSLLVLAASQAQCQCQGDRYCLDGRCIDPGYPHISIFADPIVRGGCSTTGPGQRAASDTLPVFFLSIIGIGIGTGRARRRRRADAPHPPARIEEHRGPQSRDA